MKNQDQMPVPFTEIEEIRKIRQQLANFSPAEGTIEVVFHLPTGETVKVPIVQKSRVRLLSKEVRNYLAEEQLVLQCTYN